MSPYNLLFLKLILQQFFVYCYIQVIAIREQRCSFESELAVLNEQLQVMRDVLLSRTTERQLRQAYQYYLLSYQII